MPIATLLMVGLALAWALWHLTYLLSGRGQRDLDLRGRLRRYTGS
ncbi:MAG: hypothetical protein ACRD3I_07330 [Terriglobales bacterium]